MDERERTSFFEEQARRRRDTWRATFVCALASCVMGAPLAVLVTPLVFLAAGLSLKYLPGQEAALSSLIEAGRFIPLAIETAADADDASSFFKSEVLLALAMLLAPGMAMLLLVWFFLKRRFQRSGVGGLLLTLSARKPLATDLEELQLANVVEEMAIAASMRPPEVLILDDDAPNAAAVGSSEKEAIVVVSRGVLGKLDRDETQAVVGHLIGSIGSGDLRILGGLNAVFQCAGLVLVVLDAAFGLSPSAMRDLARTLRFIFGSSRDPREAAEIEKLLVTSTGKAREDGIHHLSETPTVKKFPFLNAVLLPFLLANVVALFLQWQTWLIRS
ncbi:MAG: M48 family metalloprotease, partial [Vicinamibacteria bacterium]